MTCLLPTTVVGSYPQPEWLVDRAMLGSRLPPRTRAGEIWRVPPAVLEQAQDDATVVAIRDMERAGIDIITGGERATRTDLPPRSKGWTGTIQAPPSTAPGPPTRFPALSVPSAASVPSRC